MKKTRKLIPALAMLLVSAVMMSTASYAWFSMNDTVTADGMAVKAEATGSLVITSGASISLGATSLTTDLGTVTGESGNVKSLTPITYFNADEAAASADDTITAAGYYKVKNGTSIDPATGVQATGKTVEYEAIETDTSKAYYVDYIVYLAASGAALENVELEAKVAFNGNAGPQKAVTVDFLVGSEKVTSAQTYQVGDVNDTITANGKTASSATVDLGTLNIPLNTGDEGGYIPVVMRVYVDGALEETSGKTYVRSDAGDVQEVSITVTFTVK